MFKGANRLIEHTGEGGTPAVGRNCKPQTEGQEVFIRPGKAVLTHRPTAPGGSNADCTFRPPCFPPIPAPTLAQSYLKTGQKCPPQAQFTMAHPRGPGRQGSSGPSKGPKRQVKCARSRSESRSRPPCVKGGHSCLCSTSCRAQHLHTESPPQTSTGWANEHTGEGP